MTMSALMHGYDLSQQAHLANILYGATGVGCVFFWSLSYYPQLIQNWHRKSTAGMSIASLWYSLLGFTLFLAYTIFAPMDMAMHALQDQIYAVQDQIFAVHALLITALTLMQVPFYATNTLAEFPQFRGQRVGFLLIAMDLCLLLTVGKVMTMMDIIYACGSLRGVTSFMKYAPQLWLNYQRKSTDGFAMGSIYCDFAGCVMCLLQLLISCQYDPSTATLRSAWNWDPIMGNKSRVFLGCYAIKLCLGFMYQHFVLYPGATPQDVSPLLSAKTSASQKSYGAGKGKPSCESGWKAALPEFVKKILGAPTAAAKPTFLDEGNFPDEPRSAEAGLTPELAVEAKTEATCSSCGDALSQYAPGSFNCSKCSSPRRGPGRRKSKEHKPRSQKEHDDEIEYCF